MTLIAHVSDFHLLEHTTERRSVSDWARLRFLSVGRPLHSEERQTKLVLAIKNALRLGAEHIAMSGDLTEDGTPEQFEMLASIFHQTNLQPEQVTFVPGNHDGYTSTESWTRSLHGPLRRYRHCVPNGQPRAIGNAIIYPVSTMVPQHFVRSAGALSSSELITMARLSHEGRKSKRAVVVVQHHPPLAHPCRSLGLAQGLRNHRAQQALLRDHSNVYVLHGHTHHEESRSMIAGRAPQLYSCESVAEGQRPLRLYKVSGTELHAVENHSRVHASLFNNVVGDWIDHSHCATG